MKKSLLSKTIALCALVMVLAFVGCVTDGTSTSDVTPVGAAAAPVPGYADLLQNGDRLKITFSGLNEGTILPMHPIDVQINESGTISLPLVGAIKASGASISDLESAIYKAYVPKYYKNLNVTVSAERFFFVGGEVKNPSRLPYLGGVTVLQAIQSAGDFTDFADRKHVRLTRVNGQNEIINCKKALHDRKLDLPVYPGDTITVPRGL